MRTLGVLLLLGLLAVTTACRPPHFLSGLEAQTIREEGVPPPPKVVPGVDSAGTTLVERWDEPAASLRMAASRAGVVLDAATGRWLAGVGHGAILDANAFLGSPTGVSEEAWMAGAPLVGLQATFHITRFPDLLLKALRRELASGAACVVSLRPKVQGSQVKGGPLRLTTLHLPILGYEGNHFITRLTTGKNLILSDQELIDALQARWVNLGYGWSYGFTSLRPGPKNPDLRPLFRALGHLSQGEVILRPPVLGSGAEALQMLSSIVAKADPPMGPEAWQVLGTVITQLEASRRVAVGNLTRRITAADENAKKEAQASLDAAVKQLRMAADNYQRILTDYAGMESSVELMWGAMGLLRDAAQREAEAGKLLVKLGEGPEVLTFESR